MKTNAKYIDDRRQILNPFARDIEPARGDKGFVFSNTIKGINREKRQVTAVLSTASIDRYGEIVLPSAFVKHLPRFMENPKFLAGHAYSSADGSPTSIGKWVDMKVTEEGLIGTAQFLPAGDALADKWWFRFEHDAARTFSVGFIARDYEMRDVEVEGAMRRVRHFTEAELLEVSAVEIPANADAQLLEASFGGRGNDLAVREAVRAELSDARLATLLDDVIEARKKRTDYSKGHGDAPSRDNSLEGHDEFVRQLQALVG